MSPTMMKEFMEFYNLNVPNSVSAFDIARVYEAVTEFDESGTMYNVCDCLKILDKK